MMKSFTFFSASLVISLCSSLHTAAQVTIQDTITVESLVNEYFNSGTLVTISNITFNGLPADQVNN